MDTKKNILNLSDIFAEEEAKNDIYDKHGLKKRYLKELLKDYDINVVKNTYYSLTRCMQKEMRENKDICEFSPDKIRELVHELNRGSFSTLRFDLSNLAGYVDYCYDEGFVDIGYNIIRTLHLNADESEYINNVVFFKSYANDETINNLIKETLNFQDEVIFQLLYFEGIRGVGNCELINLTIDDIDRETNMVTLRNNKGEITRTKKISSKSMEIVISAYEESEYTCFFGVNNREFKYVALPDDRHILKTNNGAIKSRTIDLRVTKTAKAMNEPYLTVTNIHDAGIINYVLKKVERENISIKDLTTDDYKEACVWGGKRPSNYVYLRDNVEKIVELKKQFDFQSNE